MRDQDDTAAPADIGPLRDVTRRDLLRISGFALFAASLSSCQIFSQEQKPGEPTGQPATPTAAPAGPKEAPELAPRVKSGELPPLEQRIPQKPLIVQPVERAGTYGGTMRSALRGTVDRIYIGYYAGYEHLVRWSPEWTGAAGTEEILPNVAESYQVSPDGKQIAFKLRPGMKWSDGEPFTADDVVFAINDVLLEKDFAMGAANALLRFGSETATIQKQDDYAFTITFPQAAALGFLSTNAQGVGANLTKFPRHYLEKFHKKYSPDVDRQASAEGHADWVKLFQAKSETGTGAQDAGNPDLPRLWAWLPTTAFGTGQQMELRRNPYYWKTDPDGRQLPYIDRIAFDMVSDGEVMLLKALNGEITFESGSGNRFTSARNKPVLADGREKGQYRFIDYIDTRMNLMVIYLNQVHADLAKREVYANKDFRIGLSHAINRQEIIDVTMQRQGEPYQAAPVPESAFYDEGFATQYLKYDVALANQHLDKVVPSKDAAGMRLGPTGGPLVVTIDAVPAIESTWPDMLELVKKYWQAVGIQMTFNTMERSLHTQRINGNQHDATVWVGPGGLDVLLNPRDYLPMNIDSYYGRLWANFYLGRSPAEEPPDVVKRQLDLWDQVRSATSGADQTRLMKELLAISKEQFYGIGVAREAGKYTIAANNLRNVPQKIVQGFSYYTPAPTNLSQYFISNE